MIIRCNAINVFINERFGRPEFHFSHIPYTLTSRTTLIYEIRAKSSNLMLQTGEKLKEMRGVLIVHPHFFKSDELANLEFGRMYYSTEDTDEYFLDEAPANCFVIRVSLTESQFENLAKAAGIGRLPRRIDVEVCGEFLLDYYWENKGVDGIGFNGLDVNSIEISVPLAETMQS